MNSKDYPIWEPRIRGLLTACVLLAVWSLAVLLLAYPFFPLPSLPEQGISPKPEIVKLYRDTGIEFYTRNYAVLFGGIGLVLGALIALMTTQKRMASVVAASTVGVLLGSLGGYTVGYYVYMAIAASTDQSLVQSCLFHFLVWGIPIAGVVLAVSGLHNSPDNIGKQTIATLVVVLVAAVGYGMISTLLFPNANQLQLVPESTSERIVWSISYPMMIGVGLLYALRISSQHLETNKAGRSRLES